MIKEAFIKEIDEIIEELNKATKAYDSGNPVMSDKDWDDKYFKLAHMEREYNYYSSKSPTQKINYTIVNELKKVKHSHSMLSLDKTKELKELVKFTKDKEVIAMCKMDGISCSLTYIDGKLVRAETRGNGIEGEDITHNAMTMKSIPKAIDIKGTVFIDGEVICTYNDFKFFESKYENPRNFAAGSIRLLDSKEAEKRKLTFVAWESIIDKYYYDTTSLDTNLFFLEEQGFAVVPYCLINNNSEKSFFSAIEYLKEKAKHFGYPIDGIVIKFNDKEYGESLGATAHHKKDAIAYKFYDEECETKLRKIIYEPSRNGILTPVAIFEPIELEGTTVEKASLHNLSILKELLGDKPYNNQKIWVCKKNQIIPQITRAEKDNIDNELIVMPLFQCPCCGENVEIKKENESEISICSNPNCEGKEINKIVYYCSKKGMDIKHISKATITKLMEWGWVNNITDIYSLKDYKQLWTKKAGFGVASVSKILASIEESKKCRLSSFISALGIPLIGSNIAIELCKHITTYNELKDKINSGFDFTQYDGFGEKMDQTLKRYNYDYADKIAELLFFIDDSIEEKDITDNSLKGKSIVITGKLIQFKNREILKLEIEKRGGKVCGSISSKTSFLVNNDLDSLSSKNKKAKELGIPIITEENLIKNYLT